MKISDILKKLAAGEELTDAEKTFASEYSEPNPQDAINAAAAEIRKKEEAKFKKEADKLQAQIAELNEQIEGLQDGGSTEIEKLQRQLEKQTKQLEQANAKSTELEKKHADTHRNYALEKRMAGITWLDDSARSAGEILLRNALADVDDLTDDTQVAPILEGWTSGQGAHLIKGQGPNGGTGTPANDGKNNQPTATAYKPGMFRGKSYKDAQADLQKIRDKAHQSVTS